MENNPQEQVYEKQADDGPVALASTLGRLVIRQGERPLDAADQERATAWVEQVRTHLYGPPSADPVAPWSPPGLAIPRLWELQADPFGDLFPLNERRPRAHTTYEDALPVVEAGIRALRPKVQAWARAQLPGLIHKEAPAAVRQKTQALLNAAFRGAWPARLPSTESKAQQEQGAALRAVPPVEVELTELVEAALAKVPPNDRMAFVLGTGNKEPLAPLSEALWEVVEREVRARLSLARAANVAISDTTRIPDIPASPPSCSGGSPGCIPSASILSFRLPESDTPKLPVLSPNVAEASHYARAIAQEFGASAGAVEARFMVHNYGPGLGPQLAALVGLPAALNADVLHKLIDTQAKRRVITLKDPDGTLRGLAHASQGLRGPLNLPQLCCTPGNQHAVGTVTVFGAGIAGLTAAHELAERGFQVQVVEKAFLRQGEGAPFAHVGGLARSQFAVEAAEGSDTCMDPCAGPSARLEPLSAFKADAALPLPLNEASPDLQAELAHWVLAGLMAGSGASARILVSAQLASSWLKLDDGTEAAKTRLGELAAGLVFATTGEPNAARSAARYVRDLVWTVQTESCDPCAEGVLPSGSGVVEFALPCGVFPGEHGYRFFPSFYRHLFNTMGRTPLYETSGQESRQTTLDNLVSTYQQVFAGENSQATFTRDRPASFEAFRSEYVRMLESLGFEKRDITRLMLRLFRFMSTCSERRAKEFEDVSWWAFLTGATPDAPEPRYTYSPEFERHLKAAPQALVAMDAIWGDARTQGNIVVQLLLDQFSAGGPTDSTLNGPTSSAWLELWRLHLQTLGVHFFTGELQTIKPAACPPTHGQPPNLSTELLTTQICWPDGKVPDCFCEATNYYVLAVDVVTAEKVTQDLRVRLRDHGVPGNLDGYTTRVPWDGPSLIRRQYYRVVAPDRLPADATIKNGIPGIVPSEIAALNRESRVTPHELLPLAIERVAMALSFLGRQSGRHIGQIETRILRNRPGELRVARIVVECLDTPSKTHRELQGILAVNTTNVDADVIAAAGWVKANLPATDILDMAHLQLVVEPEEDRLQAELTEVVRPTRRYGDTPRDRLQTFAGIQYFFRQDLKVARGHVYYYDTDWGLSSISQLQFWRYRRVLRDQDIRGILSVDIGDWRKPSRYLGRAAIDCSAREIASEVWRQIAESLRRSSRFGSRSDTLPIPQPAFWYLDDALIFGHIDAGSDPTLPTCVRIQPSPCEPLLENHSPFLVNNVSDWVNRPGADPMDPDHVEKTARRDEPFIWQADHGGYQVHFGQLVFAGTYTRTFTRMTTMEAANESARHAVNAILDHVTAFGQRDWGSVGVTALGGTTPTTGRKDTSDLSAHAVMCHMTRDAKGGLIPTPAQAIAGDYCDIWDPEKHELDDMAFFKRVDALLLKMGKPHLSDILGLDTLADQLHPESSSPAALLSAVIDTLRRDFSVGTEEVLAGGKSLEGVLKGIGEKAKAFLKAKLER